MTKPKGNNPKPGEKIKVDPIKDPKDIKTIKKLLADHPRDLCLFVLGINTAFRAGELLTITAGQVGHLRPGESFEVWQTKTKKYRRVTCNQAAHDVIQNLLKSSSFKDEDFLFTGQRGKITVGYVTKLVKKWCKTLNLPGNYGSHTLRKTFGYQQRVLHNTALPLLVEVFGHSTQQQTLQYLGIQDDEVKSVFMNEI